MGTLFQANLVDRAMQSPNAFIFGCASFIPFAIGCLCMMSWMFSQEISPLEGFTGIGIFMFFMFLTIRPPADWVSPITFGASLVMVITYPLVKTVMDLRLAKQIDHEQVKKAVDGLIMNPTDYLRMTYLARVLYDHGYTAHALAISERAFDLAPPDLLRDEKRQYNYWYAYAEPEKMRLKVCKNCHTTPPADAWMCPKCGFRHLEDVSVLGGKFDKNLVTSIGIGLLLLLAIPAMTAFGTLATLIGVPILLLLAGLIIWRMNRRKIRAAH